MMENKVQKEASKKGGPAELLVFMLQVIVAIALFQSFLFQPFLIPSGSMRPTLLVGDYVLVSKYNYGYSKASFPFSLPLFSGRIFGAEPKRGDIVVFQHKNYYTGKKEVYIKRVIGLPKDRLSMKNGVVYINDKPIERKRIGILDNPDYSGAERPVEVYQEVLESGVRYNTLSLLADSRRSNFSEVTIPEQKYFMLGDNRDDSEDSRFSLGYVSYDELIGKARILLFSMANNSLAYQFWRWPFDLRASRLFSSVNELSPLKGLFLFDK